MRFEDQFLFIVMVRIIKKLLKYLKKTSIVYNVYLYLLYYVLYIYNRHLIKNDFILLF